MEWQYVKKGLNLVLRLFYFAGNSAGYCIILPPRTRSANGLIGNNCQLCATVTWLITQSAIMF